MGSVFDPPPLPMDTGESWIPPSAYFYATLIVASATVLKAYVEMVHSFSTSWPRTLLVAYLVSAWAVVSTLIYIANELSVPGEPPVAAFQFMRSCLIMGAIFLVFGPFLLLPPQTKVNLSPGFLANIVAGAQRKETRYVALVIFVLVAAAQGFVAYNIFLVMARTLTLDVANIIGIVGFYCIVVAFYLLAFYCTMMRTTVTINGVDILLQLRSCVRLPSGDNLLNVRPYLYGYIVAFALTLAGAIACLLYYAIVDVRAYLDAAGAGERGVIAIIVSFFVICLLLLVAVILFFLNEVFHVKLRGSRDKKVVRDDVTYSARPLPHTERGQIVPLAGAPVSSTGDAEAPYHMLERVMMAMAMQEMKATQHAAPMSPEADSAVAVVPPPSARPFAPLPALPASSPASASAPVSAPEPASAAVPKLVMTGAGPSHARDRKEAANQPRRDSLQADRPHLVEGAGGVHEDGVRGAAQPGPQHLPGSVKRVPFASIVLSTALLGRGHHSYVQRGTVEGQVAAVKVMRTGTDDTTMEAALQEAAILSQLRPHPNLVAFFGISTDGPDPHVVFLATEICNAGDLHHYLTASQTMDRLSLIEFCLMGAQAVRHLHVQEAPSIVHGDIAVRNMLLHRSPTGQLVLKLCDFGHARRLLDGANHVELAHHESIAIRWAAPEVLRSFVYYKASDIWSLGVAFWEIFSFGALPYAEIKEYGAVQARVIAGTIRLSMPEGCDPATWEVIEACLNVDWRERPNANDLVARLEICRLREEVAVLRRQATKA